MDPFIIKLLASFVVGCVWITAVTVVAERFGGSVGGFIGGMPATVVIALAFIAWTQGARPAAEVAALIPLAFAANAIFLVAYVLLARQGLLPGIIGALVVWLFIQFLVLRLQARNFRWELGIWLLTTLVSIFLLKFAFPVRRQERAKIRYTWTQLLGRAMLGGAVIAGAVLLARFSGPTLAAILSAFPAVFLATLIVTARSVSVDFSRALATPLLISAVLNCVVFALAFRQFVLHQPWPVATLTAYLAAGLSGLVTAFLIRFLDGIELPGEPSWLRHRR